MRQPPPTAVMMKTKEDDRHNERRKASSSCSRAAYTEHRGAALANEAGETTAEERQTESIFASLKANQM